MLTSAEDDVAHGGGVDLVVGLQRHVILFLRSSQLVMEVRVWVVVVMVVGVVVVVRVALMVIVSVVVAMRSGVFGMNVVVESASTVVDIFVVFFVVINFVVVVAVVGKVFIMIFVFVPTDFFQLDERSSV